MVRGPGGVTAAAGFSSRRVATMADQNRPARRISMAASALVAPAGRLVPHAIHRSESELPFVQFYDGLKLQLLQADVEAGIWVVRTRFTPGTTIQTHKHTGSVYAFTLAGRWKYLEYPETNTAGSYLFEPAGSIHTLTVPADVDGETDVWFAITGANLNLDADGRVVDVLDAGTVRDAYFQLCEAQGLPRPNVVGR
jgi:2,4'-dihydroxyacetophenone dioxygenase